jgi:hypothetical protein
VKIIGINGGFAQPPSFGPDRRHVNDGSAALLVDGSIKCATIEERHTRHRYAGGFHRSASACLVLCHFLFLGWPCFNILVLLDKIAGAILIFKLNKALVSSPLLLTH